LPLPEWYLPKGTINATDGQLETASSSCERWGLGGAGVVVIAVIAELIIAWIEPPYNSFLTDSAIADGLIALGITVEVVLGTMWNNRIQTELRKRSNKKVEDAANRLADVEVSNAFLEESSAKAMERAATAGLETERLRARLAPRGFADGQQDEIARELSAFNGQRVYVVTAPSTPESEIFCRALAYVFSKAEWQLVGTGSSSRPLVLWPAGVIVEWHVNKGDATCPDAKAATALAEALNKTGIAAAACAGPRESLGAITVIISAKE
jgi:hypothetical protein